MSAQTTNDKDKKPQATPASAAKRAPAAKRAAPASRPAPAKPAAPPAFPRRRVWPD